VALGAVIIIVGAIVYSKRRSSSMGDDTPASTEIGAATSPAVSATSPEAVAAPPTVAMPPVSSAPPVPSGEAAQNGHVPNESPTAADSSPGQPSE